MSELMLDSWITSCNQVLRSCKKWLLGDSKIELCDQTYRVPYEVRGREQQDDYRIIQSLAEKSQCVLDIGANVGLTSLIMREVMAEKGQLVAFEASEACCLVWRETMQLNGPKMNQENCRIINTLVGKESACVSPFQWDFVAGNASAVMQSKSSSRISLNKAVVTIDNVCKKLGLKPEYAKIDVEGAELDVLEGMRETLKQYHPKLFLEVHGWRGRPVADQAADVVKILTPFGYEITDLHGKKLDPQISRDGQRMTRCWAVAKVASQ